jgi:hypothetical protein
MLATTALLSWFTLGELSGMITAVGRSVRRPGAGTAV